MLEPASLGSVRLVRRHDQIGVLVNELSLEALTLSHRTVEADDGVDALPRRRKEDDGVEEAGFGLRE